MLGSNFLVLFVGWEGVGLCSYLLIGFWYQEEFPPFAGRKAFIVNRIGDLGFLVALFALAYKFGSLSYREIFPRIRENPSLVEGDFVLGLSFASFVALFLFVGAVGKSAQIPLYVWLPDAMAGPTPVSALIHAATMVTAGVYMVARSNVIYQLAHDVSGLVAVVGCVTAFFAATIGLAQTDIKKVLAYSTVSQLGYMFLAAGVGAYGGGGVPPDDACVLQGTDVPGLGVRDPRHGRGAGHAIHGRPQESHAHDVSDVSRGHPGDRRCAFLLRLLQQGPDPRGGLRRQQGPLAHRSSDRRADRNVHVPASVSDVSRGVSRDRRPEAPPPRVARHHDGAAGSAGGGAQHSRAGSVSRSWASSTGTGSGTTWRRSSLRWAAKGTLTTPRWLSSWP